MRTLPRMAAVLHRSPNDRGSATHPQTLLLRNVPKFPLVPMECVGLGCPSHDGLDSFDTSITRAGNRRRHGCSRMEHILREIWRLVRYVGLGFREFLLLQLVYFASCSVGAR